MRAAAEAGVARVVHTSSVGALGRAPGGAPAEEFTGPRSPWGASIARAVHAAVQAGAVGYATALTEAMPR